MKDCLINLNKGEYDEGCLKFYTRKNTEGLFIEYSVMTVEVWNILSTLDGGALSFDAQGFNLLIL